MADPFLILAVVFSVAIAIVTIWAWIGPSDATVSRSLSREHDAPMGTSAKAIDTSAAILELEHKGQSKRSTYSIVSLCMSFVVLGLFGWLEVRAFLLGPWDWGAALGYFWLALILSAPTMLVAWIFGLMGVERHNNAFSKWVLFITVCVVPGLLITWWVFRVA